VIAGLRANNSLEEITRRYDLLKLSATKTHEYLNLYLAYAAFVMNCQAFALPSHSSHTLVTIQQGASNMSQLSYPASQSGSPEHNTSNTAIQSEDVSLDTVTTTWAGSNPRSLQSRFQQTINVLDVGVVGDARQLTQICTIAAGSANLVVSGGNFTSDDSGKSFQLIGAGTDGMTLTGTIVDVTSPTEITLSESAQTSLNASTTLIWGSDDSAAIAAAINTAVSQWRNVRRTLLYFPTRCYYIKNTTLPVIVAAAVGVIGDGPNATLFFVDPNYKGDLFSWANCYDAAVTGSATAVTYIGQNFGSVQIRDFTIVGNLNNLNAGSALALYGVNQFFCQNNVDVHYWPGRALYMGGGTFDGASISYVGESTFENLRMFRCGTAELPVVAIGSVGEGDATNEIVLNNLNIFFPNGHGLQMINGATKNSIRLIKGDGLRFEEVQSGYGAIVFGDTTTSGLGIYGIQLTNVEIVSTQSDASGIVSQAPSSYASSQNNYIRIEGIVANSSGNICDLTNGNNIELYLAQASGANVTCTIDFSSMSAVGRVFLRGLGALDVTKNFTNAAVLFDIVNRAADTGTNGAWFATDPHDGIGLNGSPLGQGSVDLQKIRTTNSQSALGNYSNILAGDQSAISGGNFNTVGGYKCVTGGGSQNILLGFAHSAGEVDNITAFGEQTIVPSSGRQTFGSGAFAQQGDAQKSELLLRALTTSTTTTTLTANGTGAASPTSIASFAIPATISAYAVDVTLVALDKNVTNVWYQWRVSGGMLYTSGGPAATIYSGPEPTVTSMGSSATNVVISIGADTVNGGLSLTFKAPNADTWHVLAKVSFVEVA